MHQSSFKTSLFRKKLAKKDRCIQLHYVRQGPAVDYQWWSERHYLKRGLLGDCTHNYWWGIEEHTTIGGSYTQLLVGRSTRNYWGIAQIYTQLLRIEQNTN